MPQTDGGYLGSDFEAFFSAVVSGAAGVYVGVLLQDAGIETDLVVRPGQRVSVSGVASLPRPPYWGSGGITVQQRSSLTLQFVALGGSLGVNGGGTVVMMACAGQLTGLTVTDSSFSMDVASTTTLGGSISLSNAGSVTLESKTFALEYPYWSIRHNTSLSLTGSTLSYQSLPRELVGAGSTLRLSDITVTTTDFFGGGGGRRQWPQLQPGTLVASVDAHGDVALNPPATSIYDWFVPVRSSAIVSLRLPCSFVPL